MPKEKVRFAMVVVLLAAYIVLALCDISEGKYRTGIVSGLFAVTTWLIFF